MSAAPISIDCSATRAGDLLEAFVASGASDRFYWERPSRGEAVLGLGAVASLQSEGRQRFEQADRAARSLWKRASISGDPPLALGPRLVGGFAFDAAAPASLRWQGFPGARLVLPELLAVRRGAETWASLAHCGDVTPECTLDALAPAQRLLDCETEQHGPSFDAASDRSPAEFRALVDEAGRAIRRGDFRKLVVARSCRVGSSLPFDVGQLLRTLREQHPSCTLFAVARGPSVLLGATPERLLRVEGDRVRAMALAGSAARGRTPEEDRKLGRSLRESKKEQEEHAIVVRALRHALTLHCDDVEGPESPELLRAEAIQHLHTPLHARLREASRSSLLDLAGALHPTPAVGGAPADAALAWLRRHEGLDRGWYSGLIGFADPQGGGELSVALRCALVRDREASLFAGAGVVAASRPEAELAETRLKLKPMLGALLEI